MCKETVQIKERPHISAGCRKGRCLIKLFCSKQRSACQGIFNDAPKYNMIIINNNNEEINHVVDNMRIPPPQIGE
jgi:hypothetical protein